MKIVIVDDDILVSSALKTILEAGGEVAQQDGGAPPRQVRGWCKNRVCGG